MQIVATDLGSALHVVGAAIEKTSPSAVVTAHGNDGAATQRAAAEPAEQVRREEIEAVRCLGSLWPEGVSRRREPLVGCFPEIVRHDPQLFGRHPQPLRR